MRKTSIENQLNHLYTCSSVVRMVAVARLIYVQMAFAHRFASRRIKTLNES